MAMALALTTTSSAPALTVATAPVLDKTLASSLLIAPTSSISLTPGPSSDPVVSNDSPSDDTLGAGNFDGSAVSSASGGRAPSSSPSSPSSLSPSGTSSVASSSRSKSPSPSASGPLSSPSQQAGQKTAAESASSKEGNTRPQDLLPATDPDQGHCFGAAGTGSITRACCASLKGALADSEAYCLFEQRHSKTWESCVSTATNDDHDAQLAVKCSGSRRNRTAWAVIALGVGVALGMS